MSTPVIPIPGGTFGPYPQRRPRPENILDRAAHTLAGWRWRLGSQLPSADEFASFEPHIAKLTDAGLRERVAGLRLRLRREGFAGSAAIEAFAAIREAALRTLGKRHFDVQMLGGWMMLQGAIAEMQTGEGKTLTATLPAATVALAGVPVHVITVNDYLVARDAETMTPLYEFLGLSCGAITEPLSPDERREVYGRDIVYCSNKQLVFDYLRDRLAMGRTDTTLHHHVRRLTEAAGTARYLLRGLCYAIVDEADSVLIDEARTPLIISRTVQGSLDPAVYTQALDLAKDMTPTIDFKLDRRRRYLELTESGKTKTERAALFGGIWRGRRARLELVLQALNALLLFNRDEHYLVQDGKVQIIDEFTGRVMADRSWERNLHQMIEAKEGCETTGHRETLARISYQQFFRRYHRLGGMTGTASEVATELWHVYGLKVQRIPTHRPVQRRAEATRVLRTLDDKWLAVAKLTAALHARGCPVLIGTRSVLASESLSEVLTRHGVPHRILNARQDQTEAEIVADAGVAGSVTVATNMAGRGTDIKLGEGVAAVGGLHVIATEIHESGRIDRQLFGRCGRQGDPGNFRMMLSLEDDLIVRYGNRLIRRLLARAAPDSDWQSRLALLAARSAQRAAESMHSRMRRETLRLDEQLNNLLAFTGTPE